MSIQFQSQRFKWYLGELPENVIWIKMLSSLILKIKKKPIGLSLQHKVTAF